MSRQSQWAAIEHALTNNFAAPMRPGSITNLQRKIRAWGNLEHLLTAVERAHAADPVTAPDVGPLLGTASRIAREARDAPRQPDTPDTPPGLAVVDPGPPDGKPEPPEPLQLPDLGDTGVKVWGRGRHARPAPPRCRGCDGSRYVNAGIVRRDGVDYPMVEPCAVCNIGAGYMLARGHYDIDAPSKGERWERDRQSAKDANDERARR